jgi:hypothetical protein
LARRVDVRQHVCGVPVGDFRALAPSPARIAWFEAWVAEAHTPGSGSGERRLGAGADHFALVLGDGSEDVNG